MQNKLVLLRCGVAFRGEYAEPTDYELDYPVAQIFVGDMKFLTFYEEKLISASFPL